MVLMMVWTLEMIKAVLDLVIYLPAICRQTEGALLQQKLDAVQLLTN